MKWGVVGSREFPLLSMVESWMLDHLKPGDVVVSGGAPGVDRTAERMAQEMGLVSVVCYPPWRKLGKAAGMIRNGVIVDISDAVVAFWDGKSPGTKNTIDRARSAKKSLVVVAARPGSDGGDKPSDALARSVKP